MRVLLVLFLVFLFMVDIGGILLLLIVFEVFVVVVGVFVISLVIKRLLLWCLMGLLLGFRVFGFVVLLLFEVLVLCCFMLFIFKLVDNLGLI